MVTSESHIRRKIAGLVEQLYRAKHIRKKFVPGVDRVYYAGRIFDQKEMQILVESALDFWLTLGPFGERFEGAMKNLLGSRDFALVNSGSSANLTAVSSLCSPMLENPLKPGDEVLTPAVTFPTTLSPILQNGLIPVFVDVEPDTYNVDPQLLAEAASSKTRAMVLPHTLGNPCDLDFLSRLAQDKGLYFIEDCCDALGGTFNGKKVGSFGELATFSFFPAHHITMGEGGGVAVNKSRFIRPVKSIRDWGRDCWCAPGVSNTCGKRFEWQLGDLPFGYDHKYIYSNIGYNLKPTDMQAAIGLAQLEKLDLFVRRRRENFKRYFDHLVRYEEFVVLPRWHPKAEPSWFGFPITVKKHLERNALTRFLEEANIETRLIFSGNVLKQPAFKGISHRLYGNLVHSDTIMDRTFFIGVYPGLTSEMADYVLEKLDYFFTKRT